jgi:hypothetical protein
MSGLTTLGVSTVIIKLSLDLALIWPSLKAKILAGPALNLGDLQTALAPKASSLGWILLPIALVWFWSLTDAIIYILLRRRSPHALNSF